MIVKNLKKLMFFRIKFGDIRQKLETHTVETHIYRLRKKMNDNFKDDNFIVSSDAGYFIK